jgi:hypothetical protein
VRYLTLVGKVVRLTLVMVVAAAALGLGTASAALADTTVNFDDLSVGTTVTNQYADLGGTGQGVTFGPLPNGQGGLQPVVTAPPAGQAQSGANVGDISHCFACEFFQPITTGTFGLEHSSVSVAVGYLGSGPATKFLCASFTANESYCAQVTLTAFDADGNAVGTPASAYVKEGSGVHRVLTVTTPTPQILGFQIAARADQDVDKDIAIDDLTADTPVAPPTPDFALIPSSVNLQLGQGKSLTDGIAITRLGGSTGDVDFSLSGALPAGVHASFAPNPSDGSQSELDLTADADATPTGATPATLTVTATPANAAVGLTPRTFTVHLDLRAAFTLSAGSTDVDVSSCGVDVPVAVGRDFSFAGPVSMSVTGATGGVQATASPTSVTFPNGAGEETVTVHVTAPGTGMPVPVQTLTVHADAPPFAERTVALTVHGTCPTQYDPQVTSMQVIQATQVPALPTRDPAHPAAAVSYAAIDGHALLREDAPTVVRVWADEGFGNPAADVPMVLEGFVHGEGGKLLPLSGSPIVPTSIPSGIAPGPNAPTTADEASETAAYTFMLPPSWTETGVGIELHAVLMPTQTGGPPKSVAARALRDFTLSGPAVFGGTPVEAPCTTAACVTDDTFALSDVQFFHSRTVTIIPVELRKNDVPLPDPNSVFAWTKIVTPLNVQVAPYAGIIDVTDLVNSSDKNNDVLNRFDGWVCDHGPGDNEYDIGVNSGGPAWGVTDPDDFCVLHLGLPHIYQASVVEAKRPLTSVTHEFFHQLGLAHASKACGGGTNGQVGVSWPPDQYGYLQSIGLDPTLNSGEAGGPFGILFGAPPPVSRNCQTVQDCGATATDHYDLMSYCASPSNEPDPLKADAWVSVRNWNMLMNSQGETARDPGVRPRATGKPVASLHVTGYVVPGGGVTITGVEPVDAPAPSLPSSPFSLVTTDSSGHQLATMPMTESNVHVDGGFLPFIKIDGLIPAGNAAGVSVMSQGTTLASRHRSAHAPTVTGLRHRSAGRGTIVVTWKASDADGDPLMGTLLYSRDDGKTYRMLWSGPNHDRIVLPGRYLAHAARARLQIQVNDGFLTTTATSPRFHAAGAPPVVTIVSPQPGAIQDNAAPLLLRGQAFDDTPASIPGSRLRWFLGRRLLGTGAEIAPAGLRAGRDRIVLEARDATGRTSRASVLVRLLPTRPVFLAVSVPRRVPGKARTLRLTIVSSVTARLVVRTAGVRTQRFTAGRERRRLKVRIHRGRGTLKLTLVLGSGSLKRTLDLSVRRN